jgi:hypothetical protein
MRDGRVLVAGSETTLNYNVQYFSPQYLTSGNPRPAITSFPRALGYPQVFSVGFSGVSSISRVVIIRQSAVTHSVHMDQRQVVLNFIACSGQSSISAISPPDATIAPPGFYMLSILYQGVPSVAQWVQIA